MPCVTHGTLCLGWENSLSPFVKHICLMTFGRTSCCQVKFALQAPCTRNHSVSMKKKTCISVSNSRRVLSLFSGLSVGKSHSLWSQALFSDVCNSRQLSSVFECINANISSFLQRPNHKAHHKHEMHLTISLPSLPTHLTEFTQKYICH